MTQLVVPCTAPEAADAQRFGPKAANLAALGHAGLPIPEGFCLDAAAYRKQIAALGLEAAARGVFAADDRPQARRHALAMKLGLLDQDIIPEILEPLLTAWRVLTDGGNRLCAVRSSALVEDRAGSSFAGQFESFIGIYSEADFITSVRSCWGALWATRALRYMAGHDIDPASTAMAVLVQPLINARSSGGGLSRTSDGGMLLSATWGLGSAIAQGEVTPDRYQFSSDGKLVDILAGNKDHSIGCVLHEEPEPSFVAHNLRREPCLSPAQAQELGDLMSRVEKLMNMPVEIEWALDDEGFKLLQGRPLIMQPAHVPDEEWASHPRLNGHPAGIGWGTGRACVVNCECELSRIAPGDVLVTKIAGPALTHILQQVSGVVAERGGSTSHLASLARERGIPMVLGVHDATTRIPNGSMVAVDGVAGIVRWMR